MIVAGGESGATLAVAAWSPEHDLAIVYVPRSRRITIDTGRLKEGLEAVWYDRSSGKETVASSRTLPVKALAEYTAPKMNGGGDEDWVLLFRSR